MDLRETPEHQAFREEVKVFLSKNWQGHEAGNGVERRQQERTFRRLAVDAGYLYRGVPRKYGGSEQSPDLIKARIIGEEFESAGAPGEVRGVGAQMLAPTLLECGAEWQKEKFVRKTLEGDYLWCQGYSEPGAGSDLASLRTRAELVDDEWVINGQKVWTSYAKAAHYMFALVRTEPQASKHDGISYLLLDMKQPGIEVRPLKQMTGGQEFNEVFFTDARTPADWIVGRRGQGWSVSKSLLKHERNMLGGVDRSEAMFNSLVKLAKRVSRDGAAAMQQEDVRIRMAALLARLEVQRHSANIQMTREVHRLSSAPLHLFNKLYQSNFAASVAALALDMVQADALIAPKLNGAEQGNERWMGQYMNSLAAAIAGGTSNIQRNIIAERYLGLPRDQSPGDQE
jgi:alkylation response protein AidB-like acyl-CoA dehydrogenase